MNLIVRALLRSLYQIILVNTRVITINAECCSQILGEEEQEQEQEEEEAEMKVMEVKAMKVEVQYKEELEVEKKEEQK